MLQPARVAYVGNIRLPTEKAHGLQIMQMCGALSRTGAKVDLYAPRRSHQASGPGSRRDPFSYYGVDETFTVHILPNVDVVAAEPVLGRLFPAAFVLHEALWGLYATARVRRHRPTLAFTRQESLLFWLVRRGVPTIYECHGVPHGPRRWLLRRGLRHGNCLGAVAVTGFVAASLRDLSDGQTPVVVEPDAVSAALFRNLPSRDQARAQLGLPAAALVVGYVGGFRTMTDDKGVGTLVEAVGAAQHRLGEKIHLVCVGGEELAAPPLRDAARHYGLADDAVHLIGRVPHAQVPRWLRTFDVATMPMPPTPHFSYNMSPMKMFEYMAAGVPIVATDLPATREILEDGETACLVPPDPEGIADGLVRVLSDPSAAAAMAERARTQVTGRTWETRAARILENLAPWDGA